VVLTEWPELAACDLRHVAQVMATPVVLDTRGIIDPEPARRAGIDLRSIGHPSLAGPTVPLAATSQIG